MTAGSRCIPSHRVRTAVAFFGAVCMLLVGCGWFTSTVKGAEPTWLAPVALSASAENATSPDVAMDANGDATAVWLDQFDGTNNVVQVSAHTPGGAWTTPFDLSTAGEDAESPQIATDANGDLAAVWLQADGSNYIVQVTTKPAGGSWSAPVSLSQSGESSDSPRVALDPSGDVFVAWDRSDGTDDRLQATVQRDGTWSSVQTLSATGVNANLYDLKVNSAGTAMAAWDVYNSSGDFVVQVATNSGAAWGATQSLSSVTGDGGSPSIALDSAGDATVAWEERQPDDEFAAESSSLRTGGSWSTPSVISGEEADDESAVSDSLGNVFLGWNLLTSDAYEAQATTNGAALTTLDSATSSATSPAYLDLLGLESDATGDVAALMFKDEYPPASLEVAYESGGSGTWSTPVPIASYETDFSRAALALAPYENGVVVWQEQGANTTQIEAAFSTNTTITSAPPTTSDQSTATFAFASIEPTTVGFECSLDGAAFAACTSPSEYTDLSNGQHTFRVEAIDSAGLVDPAGSVSSTWTVSATGKTPQTITFAKPPPHPAVGGSGTVAATASSGLPVSLVVASSSSAICSITSGGSGSAIVSYQAAGKCVIHATQPGNATYAAATPKTQTLTIKRDPQTITFAVAPAMDTRKLAATSSPAPPARPQSRERRAWSMRSRRRPIDIPATTNQPAPPASGTAAELLVRAGAGDPHRGGALVCRPESGRCLPLVAIVTGGAEGERPRVPRGLAQSAASQASQNKG